MKIGGRDFDLTKQEIEARMAGEEPELIQKHMVEVNGQMFPPKQVLAHVTGWPRTSFTTMEAQRVLTRTGFVCAKAGGGAMRQAGQLVIETVQDSARQATTDHLDRGVYQGFRAASGIALRQIQNRLDGLREQMKGDGLTRSEQAFYAELDELRSEIESDCDYYWRGTGVDWRPLKQVARTVTRQPDEQEP